MNIQDDDEYTKIMNIFSRFIFFKKLRIKLSLIIQCGKPTQNFLYKRNKKINL